MRRVPVGGAQVTRCDACAADPAGTCAPCASRMVKADAEALRARRRREARLLSARDAVIDAARESVRDDIVTVGLIKAVKRLDRAEKS